MADITELQPGKGLDELIITKVLGATKLRDTYGEYWESNDDEHRISTSIIPDYSTYIGAAWEIVEHLEKKGWKVALWVTHGTNGCNLRYEPQGAIAFNINPDYEVSAETMPLAICQAALEAAEITNA